MSYTINGTIYTLKEIDDILGGIGEGITPELQEAALDIMESIEEEE